jgi:hypothetical protein
MVSRRGFLNHRGTSSNDTNLIAPDIFVSRDFFSSSGVCLVLVRPLARATTGNGGQPQATTPQSHLVKILYKKENYQLYLNYPFQAFDKRARNKKSRRKKKLVVQV